MSGRPAGCPAASGDAGLRTPVEPCKAT